MATSASAPKNKMRRAAFKLEVPSAPKNAGSVFTCGQGDAGQLGLGEGVIETTKYIYVSGLGDKIVDVCAGGKHTIALDSDGKVWSFGCNDEGALGRPTSGTAEQGTPAVVKLPAKAVAISAGDSHSAALLDDGQVYAWGAFTDSHGSMGLVVCGREGKARREPVRMDIGAKAAEIASGLDHLVILSTSGGIYTMGCGEQGQLGRIAQRSASRDARRGLCPLLGPAKVPLKWAASNIWAGYHATFALDAKADKMFAWGLNNYGQLGVTGEKRKTALYSPTECDAFTQDCGWQRVACGQHHSLALDSKGQVFAVGHCEHGSLSLADGQVNAESLEPMPALAMEQYVSIAAGTCNSFAVSDSGEVFVLGCGRGIKGHVSSQAGQLSKVAVGVKHNALLAMAGAATYNSTILDYLIEDCWKKVLDYVPVKDIIRTERASRRWQNMVLVYLQRVRICIGHRLLRYSHYLEDHDLKGSQSSRLTLNDRDSSSASSFYAWTNKLGPSVVSCCCTSERGWEIIGENCPSLETLVIDFRRRDIPDENLMRLHKLHFVKSWVREDFIGRCITKTTSLEQLKITENDRVTGKCLANIKSEAFKTLEFIQCKALEFNHLLSAVDHLSGLTKLVLVRVPKDIYRQIHLVLDKLPNLEYLHIAGVGNSDIFFEKICRLRNLKYCNVHTKTTDVNLEDVTRCCKQLRSLHFGICFGVTARGLEAVSRNLGRQLTSLGVSRNDHLTDDDVIACINACPNLTYLVLDHCSKLTRAMLPRAAEARRRMCASSKLRMRLVGSCDGERFLSVNDDDNRTSSDTNDDDDRNSSDANDDDDRTSSDANDDDDRTSSDANDDDDRTSSDANDDDDRTSSDANDDDDLPLYLRR